MFNGTEAQAERIIQSDPAFGSAFLMMPLDDLRTAIADPKTHPSLRRKAIGVLAQREA